jgi:23S rRNA A2030 N6-methylase RlmJ
MARVTNRQLGNVGNLGDILKHAALAEIAALLARARADVSFVDTHAFQLHAPLPDRVRWERDLAAHTDRHPAYARYATLERTSLERTGEYRCSSGLVLDVLRERRVHAVLGEANAATRAILGAQIEEERIAKVVVCDDAARIDGAARATAGSALLVHVDPFALPNALWSELAPALDGICSRASDAVVVVYRYSRNASTLWPDAPAGTTGPVAALSSSPHELAAYASSAFVDDVRAVCASLGWIPRPRDER